METTMAQTGTAMAQTKTFNRVLHHVSSMKGTGSMASVKAQAYGLMAKGAPTEAHSVTMASLTAMMVNFFSHQQICIVVVSEKDSSMGRVCSNSGMVVASKEFG